MKEDMVAYPAVFVAAAKEGLCANGLALGAGSAARKREGDEVMW
jgi:hypothetical protein